MITHELKRSSSNALMLRVCRASMGPTTMLFKVQPIVASVVFPDGVNCAMFGCSNGWVLAWTQSARTRAKKRGTWSEKLNQ